MEQVNITGWGRISFVKFYSQQWRVPVLPIRENKRPNISRWIPYQTALPSREELQRWFVNQKAWGLTFICQNNLFCVDFDRPEFYEMFKDKIPTGACIAETPHGHHVIMRSSDTTETLRQIDKNWVAALERVNPELVGLNDKGDKITKIDILGHNTLVHSPDSPGYRWLELYDEPITVSFVNWMEQTFGWSKQKDTPRLTDFVDTGDWWTKALKGVSEGGRDDTCVRLAAHYREQGLSQQETLAILYDWAERCQPPFPRKDVEKCVRSAYSYSKTVEKVQAEVSDYGPPQSLNDLLSSIQTKVQLIGGLMNRGDLVMVYGTTGVGKSSFLEYIVACACAGVNIADIFLVMQPLKALFIDVQMAPVEVGLRFETLFNSLGKGTDNFSIKTYSDFDIVKPEAQKWLYDTVKNGQYDLVALDPFEDIHHLNENYTNEMAQVVAPLRKVVNELDCAMLIGHHAGGDQYDNRGRLLPKKPRGATAITDRMDSIFELLDTENQYEKLLHTRKQRRALINRQKDTLLKYDPDTLLMGLGGPTFMTKAYKEGAAERYRILEALLKVKAQGITDAEIAKKLGVARSTVTRYISGIVKPPAEIQARFPELIKWAEGRGG